ncbi:hypothetical protein Zmor_002590 [Zophobas morio]|uniref:Uncharacterized protein n=1 Tax=Zophobas morio TaxID=2755281 RepID=A0AA38MQ88_9CUCU|nr:hypothetical protein Zmor_002590 [Zophobas morio]
MGSLNERYFLRLALPWTHCAEEIAHVYQQPALAGFHFHKLLETRVPLPGRPRNFERASRWKSEKSGVADVTFKTVLGLP